MLRSPSSTRPAARRQRTKRRRLTRPERREQLLDAAAELISEKGLDAVSMEGVAARAGVSKALPYQHFRDTTALLVQLKDRELAVLGERAAEVLDGAGAAEDQIGVLVKTIFATVSEHGSILPPLLFAGLPPGESDREDAPRLAPLLARTLGVRPKVAAVLDHVIGLGSMGAYLAWLEQATSRKAAETILVRLMTAGFAAVAADDRAGRLPR